MKFGKFALFSLLFAIFLLAIPVMSEEYSASEEKIHEKVQETAVQKTDNEIVKVIVKVKEDGDDGYYKSLLSGFGNVKRTYDTISSFYVELPKSKLDDLASQPYVENLNPVYQLRLSLQESVPLINASAVMSQTVNGVNITGKGIGVCVIDTGISYNHSDLGGCAPTSDINTANCSRVVGGYDFVNNDNDPMDDHGHGTHVAGIAGAKGGIAGVAPDISIIAIKAMNSAGSGSTANVIAGINWCVNNATKFNISVISMSLGGGSFSGYCDGDDPSTAAAIDAAIARNITVVASTGNDGNTTGIGTPACIRNSTAVASTDDAGANKDKISSFSNRNNITDLLAPGSSINSTSKGGGYTQLEGTSMSAPHAAAAFALLYQKFKLLNDLNPAAIFLEDILKNTGVRITDTDGTNLVFSRIDVSNASNSVTDVTAPLFSNLTQSDSAYIKNKNYTFNATVTDFTGTSVVIFEWNNSENVTVSSFETINSTSRTYQANKTDLASGDYTYRWIANDTLNNFRNSGLRNLAIPQTTILIRLFLNGSESNTTYDRGDIVNITATANFTENISFSLFVNFTGTPSEINYSISQIINVTNTSGLSVGVYNITAHYNGSNANYSKTTTTLFMIVRESFRNSSINLTKDILATVNATGTNITLDILVNDTIINNGTNITVGTDNPVDTAPPDFGIGKFIRVIASKNLENRLNYSVLKYHYSTSEIPSNLDESSLRLYRWNDTNWNKLDGNLVGGVNTTGKFVFANLTQFSNFTVAGLLANGQSCSSNSECGSGICSSNLCVATPQPSVSSSASSSGGGGGGGGSVAPTSLSKQTTPNSTSPQQEKPKQNISSPKEEKPVQPSQPVVLTEKAPVPQTNIITGFFLFRSQPSVLTLIITALLVAAILLVYWKRMLIFKNRI